jgi:hypothetical protein
MKPENLTSMLLLCILFFLPVTVTAETDTATAAPATSDSGLPMFGDYQA